MKKTFWVVVILLIIVIALYLSVDGNNPKTSGEPIKIGAVYALTGVGSFWGEFGRNGADLAVKEINENGGVNGQPIQIIYEDSNTSPVDGVSAFKKLNDIDNVQVVIGDMWAFLTNPMIPLADDHQTVLISPTVMNASVEGDSDYFFTLGHTTESVENALQTFFDLNPNVQSVAIICSNDPWGEALTRIYEKVVSKNGKNVVEKNCTTDYGTDYRTEAAKTVAKNPDAILINGIGDRAVKALKDLGSESLIVADSNLIDGFENRKSISVEQLENVFVMDWQANQEFKDKYFATYGAYPILEAQNSYEVIRSIAMALENNPEDLLSGLKQVKYESVDGYIDFTAGTNINPNKANASLFKIRGYGDYELVK